MIDSYFFTCYVMEAYLDMFFLGEAASCVILY